MENTETINAQSIKKKWLISFFIVFALRCIETIGCIFTGIEFPRLLITFTQLAIWASLTYYFPYKKGGTKWLSFLLVITPLATIGRVFLDYRFNPDPDFAPVELIGDIIFYIPIYAYFIINCWLLRRYNKSRKQLNSLQSATI